MKPSTLETVAPFRIVNTPLPSSPTISRSPFTHLDPTPSTSTLPCPMPVDPTEPIYPTKSKTAPPLRIVNAPGPSAPTLIWPMLLQLDPRPSTSTTPLPPMKPKKPNLIEPVPPLRFVSSPAPEKPTNKYSSVVHVERVPSTSAVPLL